MAWRTTCNYSETSSAEDVTVTGSLLRATKLSAIDYRITVRTRSSSVNLIVPSGKWALATSSADGAGRSPRPEKCKVSTMAGHGPHDESVGHQPLGWSRIRGILVDSPRSIGAHARVRRWRLVTELFPDIRNMTVIDLGGTAESWRRAPVRPTHVTVLNLFEPGVSEEPWLLPVQGDACNAVYALSVSRASHRFDLVFSNSLIEHVGGHAKRVEFAEQVHALAPYHWIQTPYRYFPVEPHWLFPMMQSLPVGVRTSIAQNWPLQHTRPGSRGDAQAEVLWTELLSIAEMRAYFPGSRIIREKLAGLTKSIIATVAPLGLPNLSNR